MYQWLGSLQIHEFNQTAMRLKEQQQKQQESTSSVSVAKSQLGTTDAIPDSEQPAHLKIEVEETKEVNEQPDNVEIDLNTTPPVINELTDPVMKNRNLVSKESDSIS